MVQALNSPDGIWKPSSCTGHRRWIPRHQGTDVEFVVLAEPLVEAGEGRVTMRVHERGVGETLSCGTGACAAAAAVLVHQGELIHS